MKNGIAKIRAAIFWLTLLGLTVALFTVPVSEYGTAPHLLTCLDSQREGCPDWDWHKSEPCEDHGGVKQIAKAAFLDATGDQYVCRDGTVE